MEYLRGIQICPPSSEGYWATLNCLHVVGRKCTQADTDVAIKLVMAGFVVRAGDR